MQNEFIKTQIFDSFANFILDVKSKTIKYNQLMKDIINHEPKFEELKHFEVTIIDGLETTTFDDLIDKILSEPIMLEFGIDIPTLGTRLNGLCIPKIESDKNVSTIIFLILNSLSQNTILDLMSSNQKDKLTKLYNIETTKSLIENQINESKDDENHGLFFLDIDNFKHINDNYGHVTGDEIIILFANKLRKIFGSNSIIGRYGGDEFIVFIKNVLSLNQIKEYANQMKNELLITHKIDDNDVNISASIGILYFNKTEYNKTEIYKYADIAMYYSKYTGKNSYSIYDPNIMHSDVRSMLQSLKREGNEADYSKILNNIFEELYFADDFITSVNNVLIATCENFDVTGGHIFWNSDDNMSSKAICEWVNPNKHENYKSFPELDYQTLGNYINNYDENGIFVCNDSKNDLTGRIKEVSEILGITSFLHVAIISDGSMVGFIGLDYSFGPKIWSKLEIEMLKNIAQVISVFYQKHLLTQKEKIKDKVYISGTSNKNACYYIDTKTYQIKYFNKSLVKLYPEIKIDDICYKTVFGKSMPCLNCPAKMVKNGYAQISARFYSSKHRLNILATASDIPLNANDDCVFVSLSYNTRESLINKPIDNKYDYAVGKIVKSHNDQLYIIDTENYELKYLDDSLSEYNSLIGKPCYYMVNRNESCINCPVKKLKLGYHEALAVVENKILNQNCVVKAIRVPSQEDKNVALISFHFIEN